MHTEMKSEWVASAEVEIPRLEADPKPITD